jgi:hypothetical protein
VEAQRPPRGQGRAPGQLRVALDDLLGGRAVDEVVVHLAALGAEREQLLHLVAHVEQAAEGVVEEDAVGAAGARHHEEGHRDVDGVGVVAVREGVAVPHRVAVSAEVPAALVQAAGLLAQAVHELVVTEPLPDLHLLAGPGHPAVGVVLVQRLAGGVGEGDAEGVVPHRHSQRGGRDRGGRGPDVEGRARVAEVGLDHRVGMVAAEGRRGREADAHHVGGQGRDRHRSLRAAEHQGVGLPRRRGHGPDGGPSRESGRGGGGGDEREREVAQDAAQREGCHGDLLWRGDSNPRHRAYCIQ